MISCWSCSRTARSVSSPRPVKIIRFILSIATQIGLEIAHFRELDKLRFAAGYVLKCDIIEGDISHKTLRCYPFYDNLEICETDNVDISLAPGIALGTRLGPAELVLAVLLSEDVQRPDVGAIHMIPE